MKLLEDYLKDKCQSCKICCRFPERYSPLIPFFLHNEIRDEKYFSQIGKTYGCRIDLSNYGNAYSCPYFNGQKNNCGVYASRPLDCRLYPFMITYSDDYTKVVLVLDNNCPYAQNLMPFKNEILDIISSMILSAQDIGFINDPQPNTVTLGELPKLTEFIFGQTNRFRKLLPQDGRTTAYLWRDIVNMLYDKKTHGAYYGINGMFRLLSKENQEYIYSRRVMTELKGDKYKDKRNLCNYFQKNNIYKIVSLVPAPEIIEECLLLYKTWAEKKIKKAKTEYEKQLVEDSFFFHRRALLDHDKLGLYGMTIKINYKITGYTFGYATDEKTFCILAEITDGKFRGINQFIFREFCRIIPKNYIHVNVMDDSDLPGLRKNKLSYRPLGMDNRSVIK